MPRASAEAEQFHDYWRGRERHIRGSLMADRKGLSRLIRPGQRRFLMCKGPDGESPSGPCEAAMGQCV